MRGNDVGALRVVVVVAPDALDQPWIGELANGGQIHVLAVLGAARPAMEVLHAQQPDLLLIDRPPEQAEALLREAAALAPATASVAVLAASSMAGVRRLVSAGARDVLIKPLRREQLVAALRAAAQRERERPRRRSSEPRLADAGVARPASPIVVLGPKGGVGTTTVAANLAVALRRVVGEEVALLDFSQQFGDLAVLFNVMPRRTLHQKALAGVTLDDVVLDGALVRHASNVLLALAPEDPAIGARLEATHATLILDALRRRFRWLVVDCRSRLDPLSLSAVAAAETVLLVTTPDVLALRDARRAIEYLNVRSNRPNGAVLINRCLPGRGPSSDEVERFLGWPVRAALRDDGAAYSAAVERGVPLAHARPLLPEARRLLLLAAVIAGDAAGAELRETMNDER